MIGFGKIQIFSPTQMLHPRKLVTIFLDCSRRRRYCFVVLHARPSKFEVMFKKSRSHRRDSSKL